MITATVLCYIFYTKTRIVYNTNKDKKEAATTTKVTTTTATTTAIYKICVVIEI